MGVRIVYRNNAFYYALMQDGGIGHTIGNYGNLLFLWDVVFGTAHFTRRYPPAYGLTDDRAHGPEPTRRPLTAQGLPFRSLRTTRRPASGKARWPGPRSRR